MKKCRLYNFVPILRKYACCSIPHQTITRRWFCRLIASARCQLHPSLYVDGGAPLSGAPDPGPATPLWSGHCSGPALPAVNMIHIQVTSISLIHIYLNSLTMCFPSETARSHLHVPRPPAAGTRRSSAGSASQQGGAWIHCRYPVLSIYMNTNYIFSSCQTSR